MSALDSDFGFEAVLRKSAATGSFRLRPDNEAMDDRETMQPARGVRALSVFAGLGIISACVFVTGYSALLSDTPAIWIHRLMALTVAQSIIIAAVAMKLLPLIERRRLSVSIASTAARNQEPLLERRNVALESPAPIPAPVRKPAVGGKLAGREFLEFDDGSVEINTLVGRRRFVSLEAAREFVGA